MAHRSTSNIGLGARLPDSLPNRRYWPLSIVAASVMNFEQTRPNTSPQILGLLIRWGTMANPKNEKRKQYAHYAAHCMYLGTAATDPDARAIQREMAAEWLKLADAILHPMARVE
jgi:hypothetical protein